MPIHTFPLNNHLVIHQPAVQRLMILNPTASWIWQSIVNGMRPAEIIDQLTGHYNTPRENFERDVFTTLEQWAKLGRQAKRAKYKKFGTYLQDRIHVVGVYNGGHVEFFGEFLDQVVNNDPRFRIKAGIGFITE